MAVDDDLNVVYDGSVSFDDDLPEFRYGYKHNVFSLTLEDN